MQKYIEVIVADIFDNLKIIGSLTKITFDISFCTDGVRI